MDQPSEVKAELLPVVVSNEVERLHIVQESLQDHAVRQPPPILHPRVVDQFALGHVDGEVIGDDPTLEQVLEVDLLLQRLDYDRLMLRTVELVEHVGSEALESGTAVVHGKTAFDFEDLAHEIDHGVIKVQDDHHSVCATLIIALIEVFRCVYLGEDRVVDASSADQVIQFEAEHLDRVRSRHEAVVGRFIVRQLLLPGELAIELEAIIVALVLQIEIFLACNELLYLLNRFSGPHCIACNALHFNT